MVLIPLHKVNIDAISKGPQLAIKIDGSSSCSGNVFWPPALGGPGCHVSNPLNTLVFLRFETRPSRDFKQNPIFRWLLIISFWNSAKTFQLIYVNFNGSIGLYF